MSDARPEPPFDWHVVVCHGTSCAERGHLACARALRDAVHEAGIQPRVRTTRAACLGLCSLGPNLVVHPARPGDARGGTWYCGLSPDAVRRVVREHLGAGSPPEDLAFRWDEPASAP